MRRTASLAIGMLATTLGGCVAVAAPGPAVAVNVEAREQVTRRYIAIWQSGRIERLDAVIGDNYVGHGAGGDRDIAGLRLRIGQFHALYRDVRFTIDDQIVAGDRVATRMTATAVLASTGHPIRMVGLNISRFAGGRIVEEWPVWEKAGTPAGGNAGNQRR